MCHLVVTRVASTPVSQPEGSPEPQRLLRGEGEQWPRSLSRSTSTTQPPVTLRAWGFQRRDYEMSRCLLSEEWASGGVLGEEGRKGREALRGMTENFRSPLACPRRCGPAPPPSAHFPFPPGRRRWLKITPWRPALQRAARAAKGKDNVLAALIGFVVATF